jgi:hypothetical protein
MVTRREVDEAYEEWSRAAMEAPIGGTPAVEELWKRYCRLDGELQDQN